MKYNITWAERYKIALSENLSIKDIMKLRCVGQPRAIAIRKKAVEYCILNDIEIEGNGVPTNVVMLVTGYDLEYYFNKMQLECNMNIMLGVI